MSSAPDAAPLHIDDVGTDPHSFRRPILVVDDVPANLVAMEAALEPFKRALVLVKSGDEALAQLLERDFSLILLDVQMPGMDGFETARLIRGRERTAHVPIIFVTAHAEDETALQRAYELGAVDFLHKPIDQTVLRAKATVFVTLQEQAEELAATRLRTELEQARHQFESVSLRNQVAHERKKAAVIATLRESVAAIQATVDQLKREPGQATLAKLDEQVRELAELVEDR
jgi:CheY-like chemotaxis protein